MLSIFHFPINILQSNYIPILHLRFIVIILHSTRRQQKLPFTSCLKRAIRALWTASRSTNSSKERIQRQISDSYKYKLYVLKLQPQAKRSRIYQLQAVAQECPQSSQYVLVCPYRKGGDPE